MARSTKTRPPSGWSGAGTKRREAFCVCPKGHRFVVELFASVDLDELPEALELLTDAGLQPTRCTRCGAELALAEAFLVDQPERGRMALFVPDALAHRELELRAAALSALAASPSPVTPSYAAETMAVVGVAALHTWLFGAPAPAAAPAPEPTPKRKSKEPAPRTKAKAAHEIHAAFADLAEPERPAAVPSIPPAGPQMDGVDVNEPLLDDDWLADESIAPAKSRSGDPGAGRRAARAGGDAGGGRAEKRGDSRGVSFADLLADDDAEPADGEAEERGGGRSRKRADRDGD